ncbi:MAG: adenylate/guanylate cyclase domain-containing protein [Bauldia sp.]
MSNAATAPEGGRKRRRLGLSVKLYAAIAGAVAVTLAASVVAWISFVELGHLQRRITREHIPSIADSLRLAQQSALIAATAPSLVAAGNAAELARLRESLLGQEQVIKGLLEQLDRQVASTDAVGNAGQLMTAIRQSSANLTGVLDQLASSVDDLLPLKAQLADQADRAVGLHRGLIARLTPLFDDETLFLVTGYRSLDDIAPAPPEARFSEDELLQYAAVAQLGIEANLIGGLLAEAVNIPDATLLQPLGERFEAAIERFRSALLVVGGERASGLGAVIDRFTELGGGPGGIFAQRRAVLAGGNAAQTLSDEARRIAGELTGRVDELVAGVEKRTADAVADSNRAIDVGGTTLLALNAISILGAFLIGWRYVARRITEPIVRITDAASAFDGRRFEADSLAEVRNRTDELGDLARTFTRMADEVQARTDTLDRMVAARTSELETVANRLAKYLSPQIYNSIFASKGKATEALARKNLSIFFSDIEGFTDISDGMEPERLSFFINTYLSEMSEIAIEYGGTIDKFIGDAILVFFGDPETDGDRNDALKCARMAVRMRERVRELAQVWHAHGISKPLRVRMGITTGYCTVGNFGSQQRLEYTVLGGPVNLASRLQTAAEADTILIADSTYLLICDAAETTPMGQVALKGFVRPVTCYRLDGLHESVPATDALTRAGRHVAVNIPDRRRIREAMEELRSIEEDLSRSLPPE